MRHPLAMSILVALLSIPLMGQPSCQEEPIPQDELVDRFCQETEDCGDGTSQECWGERQSEWDAAQDEGCQDEFEEYLTCLEANGACYDGADGPFYWHDGTCDQVEPDFYSCAGL
jgi:hypothetical protein